MRLGPDETEAHVSGFPERLPANVICFCNADEGRTRQHAYRNEMPICSALYRPTPLITPNPWYFVFWVLPPLVSCPFQSVDFSVPLGWWRKTANHSFNSALIQLRSRLVHRLFSSPFRSPLFTPSHSFPFLNIAAIV